jgi:hypothetical protein
MPLRRILAPLAVIAAVMLAACGDPPDKEIQQAQGAIDTARAAGADQYAPDEFKAAEEALKRANDAVAQRDYRLALNHALDARDRAQTAAKESVNRKASVRSEAEGALGRANIALADAHAKLKAADASRLPPRTIADARRTIAAADQTMQKARAAMEHSEYPAVVEAANAVTPRLQAVVKELDAAAAAGARRRR